MRSRAFVLAFASFALAGCANLNTVFHRFTPDNGESVAVDAKERVIISLKKTYKGQGPDNTDLEWRAVCAEPSPDALAAISASAGVSAEVLQKALSAALSTNESAASIGLRTQTIQMLRDAMYRLCEGYASGALDEIGFTRLQRRYQNVMLGLLSIEQLTGAVTSRQVVLGSKSEASTGQALNQLLTALDDAQKKSATAAQTKADAEKDLADKKKAVADAKTQRDALVKANNNEKAQAIVDFDTKTYTPTQAAEKKAAGALTDASSLAEQAQGAVDSVKKGLETARKNASSGSASGNFDGTTALQSTVTGTQAKDIGDTVYKIVSLIAERDYTAETCFDTILSRQSGRLPDDMRLVATSYCLLALRQQGLKAVAANPNDPNVLALSRGYDAFSSSLEALVLRQLDQAFTTRSGTLQAGSTKPSVQPAGQAQLPGQPVVPVPIPQPHVR